MSSGATGGMQYDEQGRPYFDVQGRKVYVSPAAMGEGTPQDDTGIFREHPQWNQETGQWETPLDWSNIGSLVAGGLITAGVASAFMGGAAAPAASSTGAAGGAGGAAGAGLPISTFVGPELATTGAAAGGGGAAAAAGGTGILGKAATVGNIINGMNTQRQQGREAETRAQQNQDQNENSRYRNSISAAQLNLQAPQTRAGTSVQGDILANAKPFTWTGGTNMVGNIPVPQSSGGLSPDLFSDNTRTLGRTMSEQALQQQQTNGGRAVEPQAPLTPIPKANAFDKILQYAGTGASLYGAINYKR